MLENSYLSDRKIAKSLQKLKSMSSDKKFRVKSLRVKTQEKVKQSFSQKTLISPVKSKSKTLLKPQTIINQKISKKLDLTPSLNFPLIGSFSSSSKKQSQKSKQVLLQKNYEQQLMYNYNISKQFLISLCQLKLSEEDIRFSQQKYLQFVRAFYHKIHNKIELVLDSFNLKPKSLDTFLLWYLEQWKNKDIISLDLSNCSSLAVQPKYVEIQEEDKEKSKTNVNLENSLWPKSKLLRRLILEETRLTKLVIRNNHISSDQMIDLLSCCLNSNKIYSLDISNKTSQTINRLGTDCYYLEPFFSRNQSMGVLKMQNLNITDDMVEKISSGMSKNNSNTLRIFSLAGNLITEKSINSIQNIVIKCGLEEINLSNNLMNDQFFLNLKSWRLSSIKHINLSSTSMSSQSFIHFLTQVIETKSLLSLTLDNNNFSHHWFNQITSLCQSNPNSSLQYLSMINCSIRNFTPLFEGLAYLKNIRRININYNLTTIEEENIEKISQFFKFNKQLENLQMRYCGYNQPMFIQIIQCLKYNKTLQNLDISQNHMSDTGGREILRMLNQNKYLHSIGIQKLQLTMRMIDQIEKSLKFNKSIRDKEYNENLILQNKVYKSKDNFSWKDIQKVQIQGRRMHKLVEQLTKKSQKLQQKIQKRKMTILQLRKDYKQQQKVRNKQIKRKQQQITSCLRVLNQQIVNLQTTEKQSIQAADIEQNLIRTLQTRIQKQNERIRAKQTALEDQLQNQKYKQRKRKDDKKAFDNTKSVQKKGSQ